jgi:single-strand DNA-binding protein
VEPGGTVPQRQAERDRRGAAELRRIAMFNEAQISVVGYVASEPEYVQVGQDGIPKLTMRVAWTTRRREPATGQWVDANTSFVRVTCWRRLADNLSTCLRKGDPVLLRGRLDVRPFLGKDGQRRISVDVDANTLGHDLSRGVAGFRRVFEKSARTADEMAAGENGADGNGSGGSEGADDTVLAALADGEAPLDGPGDEDMFDDGAIGELAKEADTAPAPF